MITYLWLKEKQKAQNHIPYLWLTEETSHAGPQQPSHQERVCPQLYRIRGCSVKCVNTCCRGTLLGFLRKETSVSVSYLLPILCP